MASSVIKKPNTREIKFFDVTVPSGSTTYDFTNDAPSDYSTDKRLAICSISGAVAPPVQLSAYSLYFSSATSATSRLRILYYVN